MVERFTNADMQRTRSPERERGGFQKAWEEVFNKALTGHAGAVKTIVGMGELDKTGATGLFHKDVERYSPEEKRRKEFNEDFDKQAEEYVEQVTKEGEKHWADMWKGLENDLTAMGRQERAAKTHWDEVWAAINGSLQGEFRDAKDRKAAAARGAKAGGRDVAETAKAMPALEAKGEAMLAQAIARGQVGMDAQGKLSEAGFNRLNQEVAAAIRQQMPGMSRFDQAAAGSEALAEHRIGRR